MEGLYEIIRKQIELDIRLTAVEQALTPPKEEEPQAEEKPTKEEKLVRP